MKTATILCLAWCLCMVVKAQNVGIGTTTPTGPLSFGNTTGNKIVFWGDGANNHYGMGIQAGLLHIYSDLSSSDIAFGWGRSAAFNERMRITNAGADALLLNGRIVLRNGTNPLDLNNGSGVWMYKPDNSALLAFMGVQNNQNVGFFGGPAGWGFTYDAINSRVGIGNNNPNAPLAFPPVLGKKITLYPGNTGDVGFAVAGNRLQIYSDNPNADVAIGYDAAGTFNERFAVKPNGALALNGSTGQPGQELVSNGSGATATWVNRPTLLFFTRSGNIALDGSTLCADMGGINGQAFNLGSAALISYQFTMPLYASNGTFGGSSTGAVSIQIINNGSNVVSQGNAAFVLGNFQSQHITVIGAGDLPVGNYTVRARVIRNSTADGATYNNVGTYGSAAGCNDIPIYAGQLIIQVFPK